MILYSNYYLFISNIEFITGIRKDFYVFVQYLLKNYLKTSFILY